MPGEDNCSHYVHGPAFVLDLVNYHLQLSSAGGQMELLMRIEIFDVGHGQCAVMTSPNSQRMMIDCGTRWGEQRFWAPSLHYFRTSSRF